MPFFYPMYPNKLLKAGRYKSNDAKFFNGTFDDNKVIKKCIVVAHHLHIRNSIFGSDLLLQENAITLTHTYL